MAASTNASQPTGQVEPLTASRKIQQTFDIEFDYTPPQRQRNRELVPTRITMKGASPHDHVIRRIRRTGTFYEHDLLEHIARRGPLGGIYVDVGANIGNHSIYFGKFLADFLIAIEPVPDTADVLEANLRANGVNNYCLIRGGLSALPGIGMTVLAENETNVGMTRIEVLNDEVGRENDPRIVQLYTLDGILEARKAAGENRPVRFVKIDVEGSELEVLHGAAELLHRHRPQLAIELATRQAAEAVGSFLATFGYQSVGRFCGTPTYHFIDPQHDELRPIDAR